MGRDRPGEAFMSGTSTIEVSSTTSRSQASGLSSVREKPPCLGSISSRRWIVLASKPVCSVMRLAARPVGAASATCTPLAIRMRRIVSSVEVLPTPGPPVMTATLEASTSFTASRCDADSVLPVFLDPWQGLVEIDLRPGRLPSALDQPLGDGLLRPVQALEEDAGLAVHRVGDDLPPRKLLSHSGSDQGGIHLQQLLGQGEQRNGQAAVALVRRRLKGKRDARPEPLRRGLLHPELGAIASAVRKPIPRCRGPAVGSSVMTLMASWP